MDLPAMNTASRIDALRLLMQERSLDAFLATEMHNVRYLSGFTGSVALLLVTNESATLVTDGRYGLQAEEQSGAVCKVRIGNRRDQQETITALVTGMSNVGIEAAHLVLSQFRTFVELWFPGLQLIETSELVEYLRLVKDAGEIARIERACDIADAALAQIIPILHDQPTEAQVALELEVAMRRGGAGGVAWQPIVATGPRGAMAHVEPSGRVIKPGQLTVIDFGCVVDGYLSDMTRTLCVQQPANAQLQEMYEVVLQAQEAALALVRPGTSGADLNQASRDVISSHHREWEKTLTHGLGHGIGLDSHETPILSPMATDSLVSGQVITVEPGVYLPNIGGVRIEDTVVVTNEGYRYLTKTPKTLVIE